MSSTPRPSKRPRLSQSSSASTLRAPFKSPLRPRDSNAPTSSLSIPSKHTAAQTKTNHIAINSGPAGASSSPGQKSRDQELPPTRKSKSESKIENDVLLTTNPGWPPPSPPTPSQEAEQQQSRKASAATAPFDDGREPPADDDLISLQRTHTRLLNTLAASKRDMETALQARKLEGSSSSSSSNNYHDHHHPASSASSIHAASLPSHPSAAVDAYDNCAENRRLKALIDKWRGASRDAAEVVYASAKERVERMGGVKGMRAREREKWEWLREEERAEQEVSKRRERKRKIVDMEGNEEGEEEMGGEDDEGGKEEEEGDEAEGAEEDGTPDGQEEEDEGGGGEYTMGMMLQSFGIHPKTMGWDEAGGKWID